ncbi:alpha/beta hydrolase [Qipengyuania marisflavi]|nr:alpha/beta hydrolase [Qipengyuania marisflavi]
MSRMVKLLIALVVVALALFGVWRWAVATGSAATLDWVDARFSRHHDVVLAQSAQYGSDPAQRVELWVPKGQDFAEPAPPPGTPVQPLRYPLMVFFHGGGWHSGAPEDYRFIARAMADMGYATALVGYRLVPDGRYPAMLEDSAAGIKWVRDNAGKHGARTDRIALMGHSAGAYNVLMMGLDPQWLAAAGVPQDAISGVVSLSGPADFYPFDKPSSQNAFGHTDTPEATQPITYARGDAPPLLMIHGTGDTVVRPYNSQNLEAAVRNAGGSVTLHEIDDASHAWTVMAFARPFDRDPAVKDWVQAFLRQTDQAPASAPVQREAAQ